MIQSLKLSHFRKFDALTLQFKNRVIIFVGPNATGKTTILESIYLISTSKSHRTTNFSSIIQDKEQQASVELISDKKFKLILQKEGKQTFINDIPYPKISEFIGKIPVILFAPSDLDLILGSKSSRRHFLDLELSLLDKRYLRDITSYKKLLKERNEILKIYSSEKKVILDVVTKQLEEYILKIHDARINFLKKLNEKLILVCQKLESEKIKLSYLASYDILNLDLSFQSKLSYDIVSKTTNIGVHRDDFKIELDTFEAKEFASEGQMRNAVLAIKLSLKEIYKEKGENIILLLDDLFASIDQKRINHIMDYIKNEQQTFISTTSLFNIPDNLLKESQIIRL